MRSEIREQQAAKEETRKIRAELDAFKQEVEADDWKGASKNKQKAGYLSDDDFKKKVEQIKARKQRHEDRKKKKKNDEEKAAAVLRDAKGKGQAAADRAIVVGDTVRLKGLRSQGTVEQLSGKTATVLVGDMRTKVSSLA